MIARRGARSIRGAMGTYLWVSAAAVVTLGLVLWFGPDWELPATQVTLAPGWEGALLDDGARSWELRADEICALAPGSYQLTLFASDGEAVVRSVEVSGEALEVGAPGE
jgi:hypothetical protein